MKTAEWMKGPEEKTLMTSRPPMYMKMDLGQEAFSYQPNN